MGVLKFVSNSDKEEVFWDFVSFGVENRMEMSLAQKKTRCQMMCC